MSINGHLENLFRRSLFVQYLPYVKSRAPQFYAAARKVYDKAFPLGSGSGLSRYQVRAIERFVSLIDVSVESMDILEIGSDIDGKVLQELLRKRANSVTGINPAFDSEEEIKQISQSLPGNSKLAKEDVRNLSFDDNTFSAIFSVAVFEHLNDFERCLSEMYRVLRPNGYVYADFGPIWSSSMGHHVYAKVDGEEARHDNLDKNPVPNFGHLLFDKQELRSEFRYEMSERLSDAVLSYIYDEDRINRLFYEDYVDKLVKSPFEIVLLEKYEEHVNAETLEKLCNKYPAYTQFQVRSAEVLLKRC